MAVRYDPHRDRLNVGAGDLHFRELPAPSRGVYVADRTAAGVQAHQRTAERRAARREGYRSEVALRWRSRLEGAEVTLHARADGTWPEGGSLVVEEVKSTPTPPEEPLPAHRLQAQLYGWMLEQSAGRPARPRLTYVDPWREIERSHELAPDPDLEQRLLDRLATILRFHRREAERLELRAGAAEDFRWPFSQRREGQLRMEQAAAEAVENGRHLLLSAPTGSGKTPPLLLGALRAAMVQGHRLAFATSRTAQQEARARLLEEALPASALGRCLVLSSRERLGLARQDPSRGEDEPFDPWDPPRWLLRAFDGGVLDGKAVRALAEERNVDAGQLQRAAARLADLLIADQNLLVLPDTVIAGWFTGPRADRRTVLLVDEAHNVPDRLRDRAAAALSLTALDLGREAAVSHPSRTAPEAASALDEAALRLERLLEPEGTEPEEQARLERIACQTLDLQLPLQRAASALGGFHREDRPSTLLDRIHRSLEAFAQPSLYECYLDRDAGALNLELVDVASRAAPFWQRCRSVLAFSATLDPLTSARDELGFDPERTDLLDLNDRATVGRLRVLRHVGLDTRFQQRGASLPELAQTLLRAAELTGGNWLAFLPSRDYLEQLRRQLASRGGEPPVLSGELPPALAARLAGASPCPVHLALLGGRGAEGVDLPEGSYRGVAVVSLSLAPPHPRAELLRAAAEDDETGRERAYLLPALRRVRQAAGRLLRSPRQEGWLLLVDPRYQREDVERALPPSWAASPVIAELEQLADHLSSPDRS